MDPVANHIVHALSNAEADWARQLMWLQGHRALYSQVYIPRQISGRAAKELKLRHMRFPDHKTLGVFSFDFVHARLVDGEITLTAYSVKSRPSKSQRTKNRLKIEEHCAQLMGIPWRLVYRSDVSVNRIENVRWIENYFRDSDLIPYRKEWRRIKAALYPKVASGMALNAACQANDAELGLTPGIAQIVSAISASNMGWATGAGCRKCAELWDVPFMAQPISPRDYHVAITMSLYVSTTW